MRVIGGSAGGRRLKSVRGNAVRPLLDRVKESVFNVLAPRLPGARFLDLYSGSGSVGIEALSRGASLCVLVELRAPHVAVIRENLSATGLTGRARLIRGDVLRVLPSLARRGDLFDLVFVDPPYGRGLIAPTLEALGAHGLLESRGWVLAHHHHKEPVPEEVRIHLPPFHPPRAAGGGPEPVWRPFLRRFRSLLFGEAQVSFYRGDWEDHPEVK